MTQKLFVQKVFEKHLHRESRSKSDGSEHIRAEKPALIEVYFPRIIKREEVFADVGVEYSEKTASQN